MIHFGRRCGWLTGSASWHTSGPEGYSTSHSESGFDRACVGLSSGGICSLMGQYSVSMSEGASGAEGDLSTSGSTGEPGGNEDRSESRSGSG